MMETRTYKVRPHVVDGVKVWSVYENNANIATRSTQRQAAELARTLKAIEVRRQATRLDGCTCGGIADTGAHRSGCQWGRSR